MRPVIYILSFLALPVLGGLFSGIDVMKNVLVRKAPQNTTYTEPKEPDFAASWNGRPENGRSGRRNSDAPKTGSKRIVFLLATHGNSVGETLISYEILNTARDPHGRHAEILLVGPERRLTITTGGLAILADVTVERWDRLQPDWTDAIVVPSSLDASEPGAQHFLKSEAAHTKHLLLIGDGVFVGARAGLLKGRTLTSHRLSERAAIRGFPEIQWRYDQRVYRSRTDSVAEPFEVISSAGVLGAVDGALALVESLYGANERTRVTDELGLKAFLEKTQRHALNLTDTAATLLTAAYHSERAHFGIAVGPQTRPAGLAMALEVLPRSLDALTVTFSETAGFVTMGGLTLLPEITWSELPKVDALLLTPLKDANTSTLETFRKRLVDQAHDFKASFFDLSDRDLAHEKTALVDTLRDTLNRSVFLGKLGSRQIEGRLARTAELADQGLQTMPSSLSLRAAITALFLGLTGLGIALLTRSSRA